jgi:arsenite methyltransferase
MSIHDTVQDYYGKKLKSNADLKTSACTSCVRPPDHVAKALGLIHDEVDSKYYGCGLLAPDVLEGMHILDLGSGSGRDCFVLSKLVGPNGRVVGVDMTTEQLEVANKYIDYHMKQFGYTTPNVVFKHGYIEKLNEAGLQDNTFDIIVYTL